MAEAKEATGRAGITLEWKLSANRAPNQPGTDAGLKRAAADLAGRARRAGLNVNVLIPDQVGADWADVWLATQEVTA